MDQGLTFTEDGHQYHLDGRPIPSVTHALKPISGLQGVPQHILDAKAALGTAVHLACAMHNLGVLDEDSIDPKVAPYFEQYLKFLREGGFEVVLTEHMVVSRKYRFAGCLDLWGAFATRTALIDIKTTADIYPACGPQTAAYALALEEQDGLKTDDRFILRLAPDLYRLEPMKAPDDLSVFLAANTLAHWRARHG